MLRSTSRDGDIVCRYGDEEFVVLMPHLTIDQAEQAAERIRRELEQTTFPNLSLTASLWPAAAAGAVWDEIMVLESRADIAGLGALMRRAAA